MSPLFDLALKFGGRENYGAVLVPAANLAAFLAAAREQGVEVPYIDCLYLGPSFTEPSMELSRLVSDFPTWNDFVRFAAEAAEKAQSRARSGEGRASAEPADAVFEVGP